MTQEGELVSSSGWGRDAGKSSGVKVVWDGEHAAVWGGDGECKGVGGRNENDVEEGRSKK